VERAPVRARVGRYLTLSRGKAVFALAIASVREICANLDIVRIPGLPPPLRGVVTVRGQAVPVLDLGRVFGLEPVDQTHDFRIVIVERQYDGQVRLVGALVDAVRDVLEIEPEAITPPPRTAGDVLEGIFRVGERCILLLDVDKVFSDEALGLGQEPVASHPANGRDAATSRQDAGPSRSH